MTLIDQRILIDAPTDGVWQIISDPERLASWHGGYQRVTLLTPQIIGLGSRRRCTAPNGADVIEEVTAWVEGLGYEYAIVQGSPYRTFQGRIRLQASPDGTTVQWTVSYRPKGLLGALRDRLGGRRELTTMMANSLRQLRRQVDALGLKMDEDARARVAIRERLNVKERAEYQRRHAPPPAPDVVAPPVPDGIVTISEPDITPVVSPVPPAPAADDHTPFQRPAAPVPAPDVPPASMPSFVAGLTSDLDDEADYSSTADTKPKPPPGLREAIAEQQAREAAAQEEEDEAAASDTPPTPEEEPEVPVVEAEEEEPAYRRITPARGIPSIARDSGEQDEQPEPSVPGPGPVPAPSARPTPPRGLPSVKPVMPADAQAPAGTPAEPAPSAPRRAATLDDLRRDGLPPQTPTTDTGEMSIWDVFGMRPPSEVDADVLDEMVKSVQIKRHAAGRAAAGRMRRRPIPVRVLHTALGLRLRLALEAVRVRLRGLSRD